jgi:hypothetical protein
MITTPIPTNSALTGTSRTRDVAGRLSDATTYRATVGGDFQAAGHSQDFIIGALRSLTWKCPSSGNCTFP